MTKSHAPRVLLALLLLVSLLLPLASPSHALRRSGRWRKPPPDNHKGRSRDAVQDDDSDTSDDAEAPELEPIAVPPQAVISRLADFRPLERGSEELTRTSGGDGGTKGSPGNPRGALPSFVFLPESDTSAPVRVSTSGGKGGVSGGGSAGNGGEEGEEEPPLTFFEASRPIRRPRNVRPCVVRLLDGQPFGDTWNEPPVRAEFTVDATCGEVWSLVLLSVRVNVSGAQFDRVLSVFIGEYEIARAITAEPLGVDVSFSFERDLTAYSPIFTQNLTASVSLPNLVNDSLTGVFSISIDLLFFKAPKADRAVVPDVLLPFSSSLDIVTPFTVTPANTEAFMTFPTGKLPRNMVQARLEITATRHGADEFYFMLRPNKTEGMDITTTDSGSFVEASLPDHSAASSPPFREIILKIDDQFAGAVLPFSNLYPSSFAPFLWAPAVGIGCFGVPTYFLDVSPFVGLLVDGNSHSFAVSIPGVQEGAWWKVSGVLHVWVDVTKEVTTATLPTIMVSEPTVQGPTLLPGSASSFSSSSSSSSNAVSSKSSSSSVENENDDDANDDNASGSDSGITASTLRQYTITGSVRTSTGLVTTEVTATLSAEATAYVRPNRVAAWSHTTRASVTVTSRDARGVVLSAVAEDWVFPMNLKTMALEGQSSFKFDIDYAFNLQREREGRRVTPPVTETLLNQRFGSYIEYSGEEARTNEDESVSDKVGGGSGSASLLSSGDGYSKQSVASGDARSHRKSAASMESRLMGGVSSLTVDDTGSEAEGGGLTMPPKRVMQLVEHHYAHKSSDKAVGCYARNVAVAALDVVVDDVITSCNYM